MDLILIFISKKKSKNITIEIYFSFWNSYIVNSGMNSTP